MFPAPKYAILFTSIDAYKEHESRVYSTFAETIKSTFQHTWSLMGVLQVNLHRLNSDSGDKNAKFVACCGEDSAISSW